MSLKEEIEKEAQKIKKEILKDPDIEENDLDIKILEKIVKYEKNECVKKNL